MRTFGLRYISTVFRLGCAVAAAALVTASGVASGQDYPTKPIRLIVGFPPGGSNDIMARIVAQPLSQVLGVPVIVENKPGANATIGADFVAKAAPDGYTMLLASASPMVITPHVFDKIPYNTVKDFTAVGNIGVTPEVIAINPKLSPKDLRELVAYAKANDVRLASAGNGGIAHFAIEMFKRQSGGRIVHVPYKGGAPGATDAVAGHIEGIIVDLPAVIGLIRDGQLRAVGVMADQRSDFLPEVQSAAEQGMPALLASNWAGLFVPAGTPKPVVDRLHDALNKVVAMPDVKEQLRKNGVSPQASTSSAEFQRFIAGEFTKWGQVATEAGLKPF